VSAEFTMTLGKQGTCQICGKEVYSKMFTCDLCGKKTCTLHMKALVSIVTEVGYVTTSSTLAPIVYSTPASKIEMFICSECADALKLSLRVLAGRNKDEDKDHENKDNSK